MQGLFDVALRGLPDGMSGLGRQGAGLLRSCCRSGLEGCVSNGSLDRVVAVR
jgi:hypothetical protein